MLWLAEMGQLGLMGRGGGCRRPQKALPGTIKKV